jgi:hypothetical protein
MYKGSVARGEVSSFRDDTTENTPTFYCIQLRYILAFIMISASLDAAIAQQQLTLREDAFRVVWVV